MYYVPCGQSRSWESTFLGVVAQRVEGTLVTLPRIQLASHLRQQQTEHSAAVWCETILSDSEKA